MTKNKKIIIISLIVVLIDQLTKILIKLNLNLLDTITVIKNFFYITYTTNTGGAWSILENKQILLISISLVFLVVLLSYIKKEENMSNLSIISYSLIIGGIIGNLIDRIFLNHVIDFLSFNIFGYYFPIFNIADSVIVIGIIILIVDTIRSEKNERNNSRS